MTTFSIPVSSVLKEGVNKMKKIWIILVVGLFALALTACNEKNTQEPTIQEELKSAFPRTGSYYQIFVRSYADSDGDGIGDFNGITAKMPYLKELGIDGLWLMPIHPSPSYHGYDVIDFYETNEDYGTLEDFDKMIEEADKHGIKIIIDLVLNHTSDQHAWKSEHPTWYTSFSYFGEWMPELDFSKTEVKEAMLDVMTFWLNRGVDGFRVDAAIHIFNSNTYVNGLPTTNDIKRSIDYFTILRGQLRKINPDVYLVGEVWASKDYTASFYQGFDSLFNFDYSTLIMNSVQNTRTANYDSTLASYYRAFQTVIDSYNNRFVGANEVYIDAPFIRNHDQDRPASILNSNQLKLASEMLLTLPGNPFIYYGEEIGMKGVSAQGSQGIWDETRRLPFKWGDTFTTNWCTSCMDYNSTVLDQKTQSNDSASLFNTYKTLLNLKNEYPALKYGRFTVFDTTEDYLSAYTRTLEFNDFTQEVLVYHNLSNAAITIDISGYEVIYSSVPFTDSLAGMQTLILVKR